MKNKMEFKIIYLLTDFSDHAKNACEYAIEAFGPSVSYILINSYVVRTTAATLIDLEDIAHQESKQNLDAELQRLDTQFSGLDIKPLCKYGTPVDVVNEFTKDFPADLIVVGSKGISKLDEVLIGSVTTAIMRGVRRPVLSIPLKAKFNKMDQIVLASDLADSNKISEIEMVKRLKNTFQSKVFATSVKSDNTDLSPEEKNTLVKLESSDSLDEVTVLREENVSAGLMEYCENLGADLLIVVAKHTGFFKRFFHKSITKQLVNYEVLPILVLGDD